MLRRGVMVPALTNTALPRFVRRSLDHVLRDLLRDFDPWPAWWRVTHPAQGHSLADLAWEMDQRDPAWRPS